VTCKKQPASFSVYTPFLWNILVCRFVPFFFAHRHIDRYAPPCKEKGNQKYKLKLMLFIIYTSLKKKKTELQFLLLRIISTFAPKCQT